MKKHQDFESLEVWADEQLKQLKDPSVPDQLLSNVMSKVRDNQETSQQSQGFSRWMPWMRFFVLGFSSLFLIWGMLFDFELIELWWNQSKLGAGFALGVQLLIAAKQVFTTLVGMVPNYVWICLGVFWAVAYGIALIAGSALFHFTFNRLRLQSV